MSPTRRALATAVALAAALAIGFVDVASGREVSFSLIYIVPVAASAWWLGRTPALIVAFAAGAAAIGGELMQRPSLLAGIWNGMSRLGIFVITALLVDLARRERDQLRRLDDHRSRFLEMLESQLMRPVQAIARVRGRLERDGAKGVSERDLRELRRGVDELIFLSREFMAFGTIPSGGSGWPRAQADLSELTRVAVADLEESARVVVSTPLRPVTVHVQEQRVRQAIASLVDVALGQAAEHVFVVVHASDGHAVVEVRAPAAPALAELESESTAPVQMRTAMDAAGGKLVSLYLVRLVAESHGGTLSSELRDGGASLSIRLPREDDAPAGP